MTEVHDFRDSLQKSHGIGDDFWGQIYRQVFPDLLHIVRNNEDGEPQRMGIDTVLIMRSMKTVHVDEKVRFNRDDPQDDTTDIMIEYMSNDTTKAPGWAEKLLLCDYIAYAFHRQATAYFLPVLQLQPAWMRNKEKWLKKYGTLEAKNSGYSTLNCPVPYKELYKEMSINQLIVHNWNDCPIPGKLFGVPWKRMENELLLYAITDMKWVKTEHKKAINEILKKRSEPVQPQEPPTCPTTILPPSAPTPTASK